MAKTSQRQNVIREYDDTPISFDPKKTELADIMKQCGLAPEEIERLQNELKQD
ncbi:hypothetical protein D3C75_273240 [compost metagenome]